MTREQVPATPTGPVDTAGEEADRRGLADLLTDQLTGRTAGQLAAADRIGAALLRQSVDRVVAAILAAGWRPPAPTLTTIDEVDALPDGAVLTDRYGQIWIRTEQQWCEPRSTEVEVDELVEWAPLTLHVVAASGPTSEDAR